MSDAERNQLRQKFAQRFADEARKVKLHRITIQSYETINAEAARIKKLREQNALTPADIERMAQAEEATARALRAEGDERSLSLARQFEGFAKQMRSEANEMRRPVTVPERPAVSTSSCVGACAQRKLGLLNEFKSRFMY